MATPVLDAMIELDPQEHPTLSVAKGLMADSSGCPWTRLPEWDYRREGTPWSGCPSALDALLWQKMGTPRRSPSSFESPRRTKAVQ